MASAAQVHAALIFPIAVQRAAGGHRLPPQSPSWNAPSVPRLARTPGGSPTYGAPTHFWATARPTGFRHMRRPTAPTPTRPVTAEGPPLVLLTWSPHQDKSSPPQARGPPPPLRGHPSPIRVRHTPPSPYLGSPSLSPTTPVAAIFPNKAASAIVIGGPGTTGCTNPSMPARGQPTDLSLSAPFPTRVPATHITAGSPCCRAT